MSDRPEATRVEHDLLGDFPVPVRSLYGIHAARAAANFPRLLGPLPVRLVQSYAMVKKACVLTNAELGYIAQETAAALVDACDELASSVDTAEFPVDAMQGGAGTSTNMNVNEVLANKALVRLGRHPGDYAVVHPIETVNRHQSTNDTYPTALKVACMFALRDLSAAAADLQGTFQRMEKAHADVPLVGSSERVDAVPMTLGSQFGSFAEAIARDRWRTFKCEERLRVVNLGGTAVGTGLGAPRRYIFLVVDRLREVTGLPVSRAENMVEQTANSDAFVEVSGMLAACASNIGKIADDLRLLSSSGMISLPAVQAGSSIMPGKVNPVILEHAILAGIRVRSDAAVVAECASRGSLQICEFLPLVAVSLLESIDMLTVVCRNLSRHTGRIVVNKTACAERFDRNPAIVTALVPDLGYDGATALARRLGESGRSDVRAFLEEEVGEAIVRRRLAPESLMALGFREDEDRLGASGRGGVL